MSNTQAFSATPLTITKTVLSVLVFVLFFLFSLELIAVGFKQISNSELTSLVANTTYNPFISLFIGILVTAIIQSSSMVTALVVTLVAADVLTISSAIPIVLGANIGTTFTSSLVAFAHIADKNQFRKAISASALHDFFNIIIIGIFFPLEYFTGFLTSTCTGLASWFIEPTIASSSQAYGTGIQIGFRFLATEISAILGNPYVLIVLGLLLVFFSLRVFTNLVKRYFVGVQRKTFNEHFFQTPFKSLIFGFFITAGMQSSSVTTSMIVPLVATNKVSLRNAFPFIMGANVGTTITAVIAAFTHTHIALSIAFVHVLINLLGVLIVFPLPAFRNFPVRIAMHLGKATLKNRLIGFFYIVVLFFIVPFILIYSTRNQPNQAHLPQKEQLIDPNR